MEEDADLLEQMAESSTDVLVHYAAWLMLTLSLAVRMEFDMRILPAETLTPVITAFTARLLRVAKSVLGLTSIPDTMLAQAELPGLLGGLFVANPFIIAGRSPFFSCSVLEAHLPLASEQGPFGD